MRGGHGQAGALCDAQPVASRQQSKVVHHHKGSGGACTESWREGRGGGGGPWRGRAANMAVQQSMAAQPGTLLHNCQETLSKRTVLYWLVLTLARTSSHVSAGRKRRLPAISM